jgi:hypothetical protein
MCTDLPLSGGPVDPGRHGIDPGGHVRWEGPRVISCTDTFRACVRRQPRGPGEGFGVQFVQASVDTSKPAKGIFASVLRPLPAVFWGGSGSPATACSSE